MFGEVRSKGLGEHLGFCGLGTVLSAGVNRLADEHSRHIVAADEARDRFQVGLQRSAIDRQQRLRGVAERIR